MTDVKVFLVTVPDREAGRTLASRLLEEGLIACANIVDGVTSIYRWEGEVHEDPELLLVLKSRSDRAGALVRRTAELHPYDVPEVLALDVSEGHGPYLSWVLEECGPRVGD